jgi:hypothetical protein
MTAMTEPTEIPAQEFRRRRRGRNRALLAVLLGLCVLFYVITIARMGGH